MNKPWSNLCLFCLAFSPAFAEKKTHTKQPFSIRVIAAPDTSKSVQQQTQEIVDDLAAISANVRLRAESSHLNIGLWTLTVDLPDPEQPQKIIVRIASSTGMKLSYEHPANHNHPRLRRMTNEIYLMVLQEIQDATGHKPGSFISMLR